MNVFRHIVLYLFSVFIVSILPAQKVNEVKANARLLSVEDGLSSRIVTCAVQDKDGFMWFGTQNGLNRYDGKHFTIYNAENKGLNSDTILNIAIDAGNRLFIQYPFTQFDANGHFDNRIQILDLHTNSLLPIKEVFSTAPFDTRNIFYISNDETNELNVLTYFPFCWWKYTPNKGFRKQYEYSSVFNKDTKEELYSIIDKSVVGKKEAVFTPLNEVGYLVSDGKIMNQRAANGNGKQLQGLAYFKWYSSLYQLPKNGGYSVVDYNRVLLEIQHIFKGTMKCTRVSNESACIVYDQRKGAYLYKDEKLQPLFDSIYFTKYNNVLQVYKDQQGNRWLCTNDGIIAVTIKKNFFQTYFTNLTNRYGSSFNTQVRGIGEINAGKSKLLFANIGGMLAGFDSSKEKELMLSPQTGESGYAILPKNDYLYLAGKNLLKYYPLDKKKELLYTLPINGFWCLYPYSDSIILTGLYNGIYQFNEHHKTNIPLAYLSNNIPKAGCVYKIISTSTKGLIAVAENGLYCINNQLIVTDYFGKEAKDKNHYLPINVIYDLTEDKNGNCWIATNGQGLVKWKWNEPIDSYPEKIHFYSTKNGLPANLIYRIEQDEQTNLWIGSNKGLIRFNTRDSTSLLFTEKDGLPDDEFDRISSYKASDGTMYFGGINGIAGFDPKMLNGYSDSLKIPFKIIGVTKFSAVENKLIDCFWERKKSREIELLPGDKVLTIEFALLDFQQRVHRYAYKIIGFDKDWNYTEEGSVRISGLPAGKYTLDIKAQLENGQWNKEEILLSVIVLKAFYMQWWFIVACIVVALLLGLWLFYYKTNKLQSDKLLLENAVKIRTEELQKIVGEKELLLAEVHHRVKNNLQIISGLLQLQGATMEDITIKTAFKEGQSRINSIALIHQNLYEQETFGTIYFHTFIKGLVGKVAELFENGHRFIGFDIGEEKLLLDINTAVPLGLIVNELVTNAYKYLPEHKTDNFVSIYVTPQKNGEYMLQYRDNGPGLKAGINIKNPTTLGIELIKGLATQLGGRVEYSYQEGSIFTIYFIN